MTNQPSRPAAKRGLSPRLIVAVVLAALLLIFIFQNTKTGSIRVFFWTLSMPTWIWLVVVTVAGVVTGSLFPWFRRKKKSNTT